MKEIKVLARATVANMVCGFDILGMALSAPFDEMTLKLTDKPGLVIQHTDEFNLPEEPEKNVSGAALMALMEEYIPGRTENLHDYLIPTIGDVPPIETILIEVPDPEGPFGAKGLGEHVLIPTAPAILNAIRHATGVLVTKVPATPTRIRAAIRDKEARR